MAKVSASAMEAKELGLLRKDDVIAFNAYELLHIAKQEALALAETGYRYTLNWCHDDQPLPMRTRSGQPLEQLTTVANATQGLELVLQALQLAPQSRVLLPTFTFVATATAVLRAGHIPVLADVDAHTWLLTPDIARGACAQTLVGRAEVFLAPVLAAKTTLVLGPSGMGKSTLINLMVPGAAAQTGEVSAALNSGRHTTTTTRVHAISTATAAMMMISFFLPFGGAAASAAGAAAADIGSP